MKNRIMFLRDRQYAPVGCLAISVSRRKRTLSYQYSVLNPEDRFDRKMARVLALGRLMDSPITIPFANVKELNMHDVSLAVMQHLAASNAPGRAVRSAKLWLNESY